MSQPLQVDLLPFLKKEGVCCRCERSLEASKHINMVGLDKVAKWDNPSWGNVITGEMGRAVGIICDTCVREPTKAGLKFAMEIRGQEIFYHPVEDLEDISPVEIASTVTSLTI